MFPTLPSLEHAVLSGHRPATGLQQVPQIPGGRFEVSGEGQVAGWEYLGQQRFINERFHNNISMFYNTVAVQVHPSQVPAPFFVPLCALFPASLTNPGAQHLFFSTLALSSLHLLPQASLS